MVEVVNGTRGSAVDPAGPLGFIIDIMLFQSYRMGLLECVLVSARLIYAR